MKNKRLQIFLLRIFTVVSIGILMGIGGYTFRYAEGFSYFSSNPKACVNCHIMQPEYDSWQKASHHTVAVCTDCHLPHNFIPKYIAKAENGYHHSKGFTLQDFEEPIQLKEKSHAILQQNCLRCHAELVHGFMPEKNKTEMMRCTHCHQDVGHGPMLKMGRTYQNSKETKK